MCAAAVEVSLDADLWEGGEWDGSAGGFSYYEPPEWSGGLDPIGGPQTGGTVVVISGGAAARRAFGVLVAAGTLAEDVRCAFGGVVVPATAIEAEGAVRCVAPPSRTAAAVGDVCG